MKHLRSIDEAERTVILVQVENETGLMGADRDHSEEATRLFRSAVPEELASYLVTHRDALGPSLATAWAAGGRRAAGSWIEVFGEMAAEAFSAWHIGRYVDHVAAAGRQAYPLPMYVNAWLVNPGDERAGRWPSGGPTTHVLDVWKAAAPHLDLLAPDFYQPKVQEIAALYTRPDNPLFVPEIALSPHYAAFAFPILARFDGLGVAPFGVEGKGGEGKESAGLAEHARSYRVLRPLLPLLARHQGTGRLQAIVQDLDSQQVLRVGSRVALVARFPQAYALDGPIGRGLVLELAPDSAGSPAAVSTATSAGCASAPRDRSSACGCGSLEVGGTRSDLRRRLVRRLRPCPGRFSADLGGSGDHADEGGGPRRPRDAEQAAAAHR
jgi:hypothetical protein